MSHGGKEPDHLPVRSQRFTQRTQSQEQAAKIVRCSKYAPQGIRGCGSECVHQIFGVKGGVYEDQCNGLLLVIVQIESAEGVKNVKGIASTPGVDVLFIGWSLFAQARPTTM